jgi:membrane magnesium transporter 1
VPIRTSGLPASHQFTAALPLDISIETITATVIICAGLVLNAAPLHPIQWRVWAGKIEREGNSGLGRAEKEGRDDSIGNPFRGLEIRPGFVDVRKQRQDFFTHGVKAG